MSNSTKLHDARETMLRLAWIPCMISVIMALLGALLVPDLGPTFAFWPLYVFAILHGCGRYGWKNTLKFFAICYVLSMLAENLSTVTGFPFGKYSYTLGGKIGNIPFGVGLFYFNIGYLSWTIASILLDGADRKLDRRINVFAIPIVSSVVMTVIDLATDFTSATVQQMWIWPNGGGFYGVPWTNYLGWTFVTWLCAQIFALILAGDQEMIRPAQKKDFLWPVLAYGALGLNLAITFFLSHASGTVTDQAGVVWQISAMQEAAFLIAFYTVIFLAVFALFKLGRGDLREAEGTAKIS